MGEVRFGDLCFTDEGDEDIAISSSTKIQFAGIGLQLGGERVMTKQQKGVRVAERERDSRRLRGVGIVTSD